MPKQENHVGGRPTPEIIAQWKEKHGELFQLEAEGKIIVLREPNTADIERALAADPKGKKAFNFNRSLIENCKLYEDAGARDDDKRLRQFFNALDQIIELKEASVKKL